MTQEQLAEKAQLHRVYVAHIERGVKMPSLPALARIAAALRVPVARLLQ
jgi:transcriptional regulator with XRE-family HTH domain